MKLSLRNCGGHCLAASRVRPLFLIALWLAGAWPLLAAPAGPTVISGSASFSQQGALTTIQAANNAIINYQSFNILAHETVQFIQPGPNSRVLNRVVGDGPTSIFGNLL